MKFQVGDKVVVKGLSIVGTNYIGEEGTVINHYSNNEVEVEVSDGYKLLMRPSDLELIEPKKTKNQRITALEKEVKQLNDELVLLRAGAINDVRKLKEKYEQLETIVEELRGHKTIDFSPLNKPSTNDEIIEFEGEKYRKVNREAREGDVVVFTAGIQPREFITIGKPYKAVKGENVISFKDNDGDYMPIYRNDKRNRTKETVEVYKRIEQPKSPNQQRAEIIAKAKKFVEKYGKQYGFHKQDNLYVAIHKTRDGIKNGYACCNPLDVFNEHIGKAIALGRALGLDVSEFVQAVQPNEVVVGHKVSNDLTDEIHEITSIVDYKMHTDGTGLYWPKSALEEGVIKIINDTNAQYEVSE